MTSPTLSFLASVPHHPIPQVLRKDEVEIPGGWRSPATEVFDPDFTRQAPVIKPSTPTIWDNYIGFTYSEKTPMSAADIGDLCL